MTSIILSSKSLKKLGGKGSKNLIKKYMHICLLEVAMFDFWAVERTTKGGGCCRPPGPCSHSQKHYDMDEGAGYHPGLCKEEERVVP